MVAYVMDEDCQQAYLHLSQLASHTRNLLQQAAVALIIAQADPGEGDPQLLARLSLQGRMRLLGPDHPDYAMAKERYLGHFPDAAMRFDFTDFHLFEFNWQRARWIGGFGQACSFQPEDFLTAKGISVKQAP